MNIDFDLPASPNEHIDKQEYLRPLLSLGILILRFCVRVVADGVLPSGNTNICVPCRHWGFSSSGLVFNFRENQLCFV